VIEGDATPSIGKVIGYSRGRVEEEFSRRRRVTNLHTSLRSLDSAYDSSMQDCNARKTGSSGLQSPQPPPACKTRDTRRQ
jgi:hypothetical protein